MRDRALASAPYAPCHSPDRACVCWGRGGFTQVVRRGLGEAQRGLSAVAPPCCFFPLASSTPSPPTLLPQCRTVSSAPSQLVLPTPERWFKGHQRL